MIYDEYKMKQHIILMCVNTYTLNKRNIVQKAVNNMIVVDKREKK